MYVRKSTTVFIFITVMMDMLALGIVIPVLPKLVVAFTGGDASKGAAMFGLFGTAWAAMHFFAAPVLGALSDRLGRRPVLLLSSLGMGIDYAFMAVAPSLGWLFLGRLVSGITSANVPTAFAYISDSTAPDKRAAAFGIVGAAFGLGFILGPAIGGLMGAYSPHAPFWAAAGLSMLNTIYGFFVLPESLPPSKRSAFSWRKANPVGSLKLLISHSNLLGLATVAFIGNVAHDVLPSTYVLYVNHRYGWDEKAVGLSLALVGICSSLVQAGLVGPVVQRFGERSTVIFGTLIGALGFLISALAPTGHWYWLAIPFISFWGITGPALQGLMTRKVGDNEHGRLQGAIASIRSLAELMGPGIFTATFAYFIAAERAHPVPGASFYLAAALLFITTAWAWWVTRRD